MSITKLYAQTDPKWAAEELGFNKDPRYSIGNYGCAITAIGNLLAAVTGDMQYTPEFINNWGKANSGFAEGGGLVEWGSYLALGSVGAHGETTNLTEVNQWLQDPANFAIIEFQLIGHQHYCMAPYVNKIIDSEDGKLKAMGSYPFVSARLYTSTVPAPVATTVSVTTVPPHGSVKVTASPFLWLRQGPGTNFDHATGLDAQGNQISSLPTGAVVDYVNAVQADPNSTAKGAWLVSVRGHYFWAGGTTYGNSNRLAALAGVFAKKKQ